MRKSPTQEPRWHDDQTKLEDPSNKQRDRRCVMDCPRCGGLMVSEKFEDLTDDTGEFYFFGRRCIICGEILDPMILTNRGVSESLVAH